TRRHCTRRVHTGKPGGPEIAEVLDAPPLVAAGIRAAFRVDSVPLYDAACAIDVRRCDVPPHALDRQQIRPGWIQEVEIADLAGVPGGEGVERVVVVVGGVKRR